MRDCIRRRRSAKRRSRRHRSFPCRYARRLSAGARPASLAVLGFGIWLVLAGDAWGFGHAWIIVGLALLGAAFVVGGTVVGRAANGAHRAADRGDGGEAIPHLRRSVWASGGGARLLRV